MFYGTLKNQTIILIMDNTFFRNTLIELLDIDSPTGLYFDIENYILSFVREMGFTPNCMRKGGVWFDMGGDGDVLYIMSHCDTIGLVVNGINPDGTVQVTYIGGLRAHSSERANVRLYTKKGNVYTGTIQRTHSCVHSAPIGFNEEPANYDTNLCLVLDEKVCSKTEVEALGIQRGDIVALCPDFVFTDNGFIKSRFLDDKVNVALILTLINELHANEMKLKKHVIWGFTMYEELGHGGSWIPANVQDVMSVDIASSSITTTSTEDAVTIYTQDTRFPYHYGMLQELIKTAEASEIKYNLDMMYPKGGTDSDSTILAGYDVRHAAIGPGVIGSHGYERTHMDGILATYQLIKDYIVK